MTPSLSVSAAYNEGLMFRIIKNVICEEKLSRFLGVVVLLKRVSQVDVMM
jgi:hypothetical protein